MQTWAACHYHIDSQTTKKKKPSLFLVFFENYTYIHKYGFIFFSNKMQHNGNTSKAVSLTALLSDYDSEKGRYLV